MPQFLHHPTQKIIEASSPAQSARYRRSSRFTELTDTDSHYHYPPDSLPVSSSSPQSPRQSATTPPDTTPESHESHTDAPHATEPVLDDPTLTDIANMTVSQVLTWVDDNPHRARQALQYEQAGRNRVTLTSKLRRIR